MTLDNAPWALDGARTPARLARTASYIESGGVEGVIGQADLKVAALDVAGVGVQVAAGAGIMLNRYQTAPNQSYAVANQGPEIIEAAQMPPANPAAQSHLVCVVIGDPEFSPSGHPFMPATPIPLEERETYQYVRFVVIPNVPAGTTTFAQLGLHYPAYALARIDVPASTSTITSGMVKDLRKLARPRATEDVQNIAALTADSLNPAVGAYKAWGGTYTFDVPEWATQAVVSGFVESIIKNAGATGYGQIRAAFVDGGATSATTFDVTGPASGIDRFGMNVGGKIDIPSAYRGTQRQIRFEATILNAGSSGDLTLDTRSNSMMRVRFQESAL